MFGRFVGTHHLVFITLDTLRYDVAVEEMEAGRTPHLEAVIGQWEQRHTPASFTYAAHHAFFAGYLPTPVQAGAQVAPLSFEAPTIMEGLRQAGYRTVCVGGVGFFNKLSPLGSVLPDLFDESYWSPALGVTDPDSTQHQVAQALEALQRIDGRFFLFINVSALHQPNYMYLPGAMDDSRASHAAALRYVDGALAPLFEALRQRAPVAGIMCADHGTAYGEDGYVGHRIAHPVVWTVPYAEFTFS